jgi:hypothetical protein
MLEDIQDVSRNSYQIVPIFGQPHRTTGGDTWYRPRALFVQMGYKVLQYVVMIAPSRPMPAVLTFCSH